jgi:hypothetical protein
MGTYKVSNPERGARGFYNAAGGLVMLEPGQTVDSVEVSGSEVKSATATGLKFTQVGGDPEPADAEPTVEQVRQLAQQIMDRDRAEFDRLIGEALGRASSAETERDSLKDRVDELTRELAARDTAATYERDSLKDMALDKANKDQLLVIATYEQADVPEGDAATKADLVKAIVAKRKS